MTDVWIAPVGTPVDGPGWQHIGWTGDMQGGCSWTERFSWARELEHAHPKLMAEARRRRRREIARYRWPKISAVKTEYHRRRR